MRLTYMYVGHYNMQVKCSHVVDVSNPGGGQLDCSVDVQRLGLDSRASLCLFKQTQTQHYHVRAGQRLVRVVHAVDVVLLKRLHRDSRLQEVDWGYGNMGIGNGTREGYSPKMQRM